MFTQTWCWEATFNWWPSDSYCYFGWHVLIIICHLETANRLHTQIAVTRETGRGSKDEDEEVEEESCRRCNSNLAVISPFTNWGAQRDASSESSRSRRIPILPLLLLNADERWRLQQQPQVFRSSSLICRIIQRPVSIQGSDLDQGRPGFGARFLWGHETFVFCWHHFASQKWIRFCFSLSLFPPPFPY